MMANAFARRLRTAVLGQSAGLVLNMAFVLLAARWLGAMERGRQAFLLSTSQMVAVVLGLGLQNALPAAVALEPRRIPAARRAILTVSLCATVTLLVLLWLNHRWQFSVEIAGLEWVVLVLTVASIAQQAVAVLALSVNDIGGYSGASAVQGATSFLGLVSAYALGAVTVGAVLGIQVAALVVTSTWLLRRLRRFESPEPGLPLDFGVVGRAAVLGLLSAVFGIAMFRGDVLLVGRLAGMSQAGVYSVAMFAAEVVLRVPQWASQLVAPTAAADHSLATARETLELATMAGLFALALSLLALAARPLGRTILVAVAGHDFDIAYDLLLLMCPRLVMQGAGAVLAGYLAGRGYTLFHPSATLGGMLAIWGLDIALVPRMGVRGASVATSVGFAVTFVVLIWGFLATSRLGLVAARQAVVGGLRRSRLLFSRTRPRAAPPSE